FSQFEMIGRPADDILSEETMRVSRPFFEHARRGAAVDFDMTLKLPNGQPIDIRTFLRPEGPSDGEVVGFYLLSINVTRQKQATAALLQAQKMDALGQLSSGIAHDFNNLLTVILGNLTPLKERISDGALVQDMLEPAIRAARRGADLTRRLLTVARRNPLEPVAVDVEEAIAGLVKLLRPSMPESIEIVTSSRGRGHVAFVDPAQLETALLNLAVNARDALASGGQIRIATSMRSLAAEEAEDWKLPPGDFVQIVFEDDGPGMPADTLGRIFEPFFTTKPTGKGSGLGLSMVYGFIRQSNGMIRATSQPGKGARFTLLLPQAEHADLPVETPVPEVVPTERQGLALLVDDDEGVRSVLRRQLVDLGYPLIEASDAAEALDVIRSVDGVSVMVTDIAMPGSMNGLDLAREVRGLKPEIGIVLMTGHGGAVERAASGGEFPLLRKPFERGALAHALDQVAARTLALSPVAARAGAIA
ncbi:MAG: response regulator, partial [Hyphomicrobiaceae bacterium]|nr:response regulator [Hyphomicrobiaceae bacterium]